MTIKLNAKFLADVGAAKICQQSTMTPDVLNELFTSLMNRQLLTEMAVKARQHANQMRLSMWLILSKCNQFTMSPSTAANQAKTD